MSLSDLASLGSFVSGLAVLVSLVFLYFQLRQLSGQVKQAEKNQRAFMNQGYVTRSVELISFICGKENVATIARVYSGETDFSADELVFLGSHLRMAVLNFHDIVLQHSQGLADQTLLDYQTAVIRNLLSWPVYRALWRGIRPGFPPQSVSLVDRFIADTPLAEPVDRLALYRANLLEIMRPHTSAVVSQSQA